MCKRTIADYQAEFSRTKENNQLLDAVFKKHQVVLHTTDVQQTPHIKEEEEDPQPTHMKEEEEDPHIKEEEEDPQPPHMKEEEEDLHMKEEEEDPHMKEE
ncbi:X-linked retinitis pigmentosa GTPase regulator-interacting protein 1-like [Entelurus aequoreus]|uniref:X-linked retinitis pigmentosa GTPase regulator-interacting protein 1-like n=1 Tax=Entelurus aequoreus TaxID=161455 RepID=UPI002B1E609C|nr:X-linked retinitis pigmentosa GTPase regulator-interacting protein 1-like [Entelurus aequoreus]